jgi:hypothetical protein
MAPGTTLVVIHLVGLLTLITGLLAFLRNRRLRGSLRQRVLTAIVSIALVAWSFQLSYALDDSHRIIGFPFMAAVFERSGGHWTDFLGPMTYPALLGNCLVAIALPQLALFLWRARQRRRTPI